MMNNVMNNPMNNMNNMYMMNNVMNNPMNNPMNNMNMMNYIYMMNKMNMMNNMNMMNIMGGGMNMNIMNPQGGINTNSKMTNNNLDTEDKNKWTLKFKKEGQNEITIKIGSDKIVEEAISLYLMDVKDFDKNKYEFKYNVTKPLNRTLKISASGLLNGGTVTVVEKKKEEEKENENKNNDDNAEQ